MSRATTAEAGSPKIWQRVIWLDQEMRSERFPGYADLQRQFDISRRSATNTLEFMRKQLGVAISFSRRHGGFAYDDPAPDLSPYLPYILIPARELEALELATAAAERLLDDETADALRDLHGRLTAQRDTSTAPSESSISSLVRFTGPKLLGASHLRTVRRAITSRRVLIIDYHAAGGLVTRQIEPHFLVNASGDWLVIAWDRNQNGPRTFALKRIQGRPEPAGGCFTRRPELDPARYTAGQFLSFGGTEGFELVLRAQPEAVRLFEERKWHPTQMEQRLGDGTYEVRMEVAGGEDILRWLRGFGRAIEVVKPQWLRQQVRDEAIAILEVYQRGPEPEEAGQRR